MKAHKHAEVIKKWADGEVIEKRNPSFGSCDCGPEWQKVTLPFWNDDATYRVKPKVYPKVYPKNTLTHDKMCSVYYNGGNVIGSNAETVAWHRIANAAIEEFITSGEMMAYLKSEGIYQLIERGNYE